MKKLGNLKLFPLYDGRCLQKLRAGIPVPAAYPTPQRRSSCGGMALLTLSSEESKMITQTVEQLEIMFSP
jgi:hypothetical protein